jgi:DNA-binding transcriptional ArsR family regulator
VVVKEGFHLPARAIVSRELSELFGALAHPHRLRIIIELRDQERDVNSLQQILGISHSGVSQSLALLRAHRLVQERREGRHVIYSLSDHRLGDWLLEGLQFLEGHLAQNEQMRGAVEEVKNLWHVQEAAAEDSPDPEPDAQSRSNSL